jgi:predicted permease
LVYMWTPLSSVAGLPRERQPFYTDVAAWSKTSHSLEGITAMQRYAALLDDSPQRIGAAKVFGNFFKTLEARAEVGRTIDTGDDQMGNQFVAVISDRLWHWRFGGDPKVLGKNIRIDRQSYRVIGIMGKEFSYPHGNDFPGQYQFASLPGTDICIPAALTSKQKADRDFDNFDAVIGRLGPRVSLSQAQSEISVIEKRLKPLHSQGWGNIDVLLVPFIETAIGPVRPLLRLLMAAVFLVLLLACSNFASLLMARAADRIHEMGIRAAVGAGPGRLIRLMLTEALMLSIAGGVLGIILSFVALRFVVRLNPGDIPRFEEVTVDMRVLMFAVFASIGTGVVSGVFPALSAAFANIGEQLGRGGRAITGVSRRARNVLIVAQIALSVVLLVS